MKIDKKSLIRATIFSAILGLNGVTAMGEEHRSRWDINNSQNDHAKEMIEMDELAECSICLQSKKKDKVLKTYCCKQDICEACIKGIHYMAHNGEGYRTQDRCPFCTNDTFEGWGKLVIEVVKPEKDEDTKKENTEKIELSKEDKQKISQMDPKKQKAVIDSFKAAAAAQA